jgi:hypothetical protein
VFSAAKTPNNMSLTLSTTRKTTKSFKLFVPLIALCLLITVANTHTHASPSNVVSTSASIPKNSFEIRSNDDKWTQQLTVSLEQQLQQQLQQLQVQRDSMSVACNSTNSHGMELAGVTNLATSYTSDGRTVYIYRLDGCTILTSTIAAYCSTQGHKNWRPTSSNDVNTLITTAYALDNFHSWIVIGTTTGESPLITGGGNIGGYSQSATNSNNGDGSSTGWAAFRKWSSSFCDPGM